ncbi:MAG: AI-2E family transporter [Alicyclobacillaceae bacterium]|jgi:predicted PurR-regulated permease PerM|uniref:AI-2E family transporter n=1 Tax=Alicyclobacillus sp. SP_1 TaxID=2942475 RepID=UPI002157442A|nr:AI-2E family transporter [Alicyclobacillus sp. SP_1]MCY0888432.1 AI-2E family transporter [Alicyclobacillaceae bacterium]MCY0895499.1 AI-2E family transporter [Alicyclobacillaceae bacterium]
MRIRLSRYTEAALAVLLTLLCVYLLGQLRGFFHDIWMVARAVLFPFLAALIVTYILQPIVQVLSKRKVPRTIAILLIYVVAALLIALALSHTVPTITRQSNQLVHNLPSMMAFVNQWVDDIVRRKQYLPDALRVGMENALNRLESQVTGWFSGLFTVVSGVLNTVFMVFLVPFLVFYMLKDGRGIGRAVVRLWPKSRREEAKSLLLGIDATLGRYIRGQLLVMLAVGILAYIGYLVVGMPYALMLALFLAVADIIPYIGPFIGAAPALLLALPLGFGMVVKILIVNVIVQQCEGNLISPQIMGRSLRLHPMAIVAVLLLGGELGGILGLIAAVPLLAVAKVIWLHVRPGEDTEQH